MQTAGMDQSRPSSGLLLSLPHTHIYCSKLSLRIAPFAPPLLSFPLFLIFLPSSGFI